MPFGLFYDGLDRSVTLRSIGTLERLGTNNTGTTALLFNDFVVPTSLVWITFYYDYATLLSIPSWVVVCILADWDNYYACILTDASFGTLCTDWSYVTCYLTPDVYMEIELAKRFVYCSWSFWVLF